MAVKTSYKTLAVLLIVMIVFSVTLGLIVTKREQFREMLTVTQETNENENCFSGQPSDLAFAVVSENAALLNAKEKTHLQKFEGAFLVFASLMMLAAAWKLPCCFNKNKNYRTVKQTVVLLE